VETVVIVRSGNNYVFVFGFLGTRTRTISSVKIEVVLCGSIDPCFHDVQLMYCVGSLCQPSKEKKASTISLRVYSYKWKVHQIQYI
jgi:hypothetical protein